MSDIEKIERYIKRTNIAKNPCYAINLRETCALKNMENIFDVVYLAFQYGRAKGYREAKAEAQK